MEANIAIELPKHSPPPEQTLLFKHFYTPLKKTTGINTFLINILAYFLWLCKLVGVTSILTKKHSAMEQPGI